MWKGVHVTTRVQFNFGRRELSSARSVLSVVIHVGAMQTQNRKLAIDNHTATVETLSLHQIVSGGPTPYLEPTVGCSPATTFTALLFSHHA
jgi:hypothetical protein